jgi:dephospho-CoA kinase
VSRRPTVPVVGRGAGCQTDDVPTSDAASSEATGRKVIALTGGIGAGKSSVGRLLADLGAVVVDADALAREVIEPRSPGFAAVVAAFGEKVVGADGMIDRPRLAERVFSDHSLRDRLERIVHPLVQQAANRRFGDAPEGALLIYEVPLLAETGRGDQFAAVVVVDAPDEVRLARLVARGLTDPDARRRMAAQAPREDRLAIADVVIDNSGTEAELKAQVQALFVTLQALG